MCVSVSEAVRKRDRERDIVMMQVDIERKINAEIFRVVVRYN